MPSRSSYDTLINNYQLQGVYSICLYEVCWGLINAPITHCICMKHTPMFAIIVPFKICFCIHIAMLQYHTTFAKIISQCSQQYYFIQNTGTITIYWFDDYSASGVQRGNDHPPPPLNRIDQSPNPVETTSITVICKILILLLKSQNSYFVLNSSFDFIIYTV